MSSRNKNRKLPIAGDLLLELEPLLFKLVEDYRYKKNGKKGKGHGLQKGELLALIAVWVDIHYPDAIECYDEGGIPIFFYGSEKQLLKMAKQLKRKRKRA